MNRRSRVVRFAFNDDADFASEGCVGASKRCGCGAHRECGQFVNGVVLTGVAVERRECGHGLHVREQEFVERGV